MENKKLKVSFTAKISAADNCLCDACHNIGRVIKLEVPITKFYNGKRLSTNYSNYWLCRECRDKLVKALEWGDEDGK